MENTGYIRTYRKLEDSEIWNKPAEWLKIWIHILLNVNYKSKPIGSGKFKYSKICSVCGVTKGTLDTCIRWLKVHDNIRTEKTTDGFIIFVANYSQYQQDEKEEETTGKTTEPIKTHDTLSLYRKKKKEIYNKSDVLFEEFWNLYPRKVGKPKSLSAFNQIKDKQKIKDGLQRWCKYWEEDKTDIKYIPHPTTYLNQERFNDETPKQSKGLSSLEENKKKLEAFLESNS